MVFGLVAASLTAASAAGARAPKITKVRPGEVTAFAGSPVSFRVKVKNSAKRASRALPLVFLLSEDGSTSDAVTIGSGAIPPLPKRSRNIVPFTVTIPAATADEDHELMVCKPRAGRAPKCYDEIEIDVEQGAATSANVPTGSSGALPSSILSLANWKLTLPTGSSEDPTEILQPQLNSFLEPQFFHVDGPGTGVVFRANVEGVTTSGSRYPRSELREMKSNGSDRASWDSRSGTHVMTLTQAITAAPPNKSEVVAGQIHDGSDDVLQIRMQDNASGGHRLFVGANDNATQLELDPNYVLGRKFTLEVRATSAGVRVTYNGSKVVNLAKAGSGWYFKAGSYTQSNTSYDAAGTYGEVVIDRLVIQHF
jgi:poly(beta-D-mannuronate) lyase